MPSNRAFYIRLHYNDESVDSQTYYEAAFADGHTIIATRKSAPGQGRWDCYVRFEKDWFGDRSSKEMDVIIRRYGLPKDENTALTLTLVAVESESSTSATATSDAAITISSTSHRRRGPATDTSAGSDAPLPFPTPNGDGAVLASKPKEQPTGTFARCLLAGKPALLRPSPNNKDGQVFVTNEDEAENRDTAFARRLRGELSPEVKDEPESDLEGEESSHNEPEEQSEEEAEEEGSDAPHDGDLSFEECPCPLCSHVRVCPGREFMVDDDEDEDQDEEEPSEQEMVAAEESDEQSETSSDREFDEINRSSSVPEIKSEPMDEAACDAAIDRMREARDACAAIIHSALDKYESSFYDAVKELQAAAPDQATINRKIAFTTQRLELRKTAKACGFKRKRDKNDESPLEELALSPMIKRLQHAQPARYVQYANAKELLAKEDIGGDVILELGVSGLQDAGLSLGTAGSIVTEVKKDKKARK